MLVAKVAAADKPAVLRAEPTHRQLAAAVACIKSKCEWWSHPAYEAKCPQREAKQSAWCADVARVAERCGYVEDDSYSDRYRLGKWWTSDDSGSDDSDSDDSNDTFPSATPKSDRKRYLPKHREIQFARLAANAQPPSEEELSGLEFPQRLWWSDRDRIVLLHESILVSPPDGSYWWEEWVLRRARHLWSSHFRVDSDGTVDLGHCKASGYRPGATHLIGCDLKYLPAPGWRWISSFGSCPNPHMRFPRLVRSSIEYSLQ